MQDMPNKVIADALEILGAFDMSLEAENSSRANERKVGRSRYKCSNIEHGSVHDSARNFRTGCDTMESVKNDELVSDRDTAVVSEEGLTCSDSSPKTTRIGRVRRILRTGAGIASGRFKSGDRISTIGGNSTSTGVKAACKDRDMGALLAIASKVSENNLYSKNWK